MSAVGLDGVADGAEADVLPGGIEGAYWGAYSEVRSLSSDDWGVRGRSDK